MSKLPYILAAVVLGGVVAFQPGLNAEVARRVGNPFAAGVVSICISFTLAVTLFLVTRQPATWSALPAMPWHLWLAGSIGVIFVVASLWLAPMLGAALLFASVIAGQMIAASLADFFGIGGYQSHAFDAWRFAGITLVLAGVWAFSKAA